MEAWNGMYDVISILKVKISSRNLLLLSLNLLLLYKRIKTPVKLFLLISFISNRLIFLVFPQFNYVDSIQLTDTLGYMSYYPAIKTIMCAEEHTSNVLLVNPVVSSSSFTIPLYYLIRMDSRKDLSLDIPEQFYAVSMLKNYMHSSHLRSTIL